MSSFYVYETQYKKHARECLNCHIGMNEGYLHEGSGFTFCSAKCIAQEYGLKEAAEMVKGKELFYTDWHDEVGSAE